MLVAMQMSAPVKAFSNVLNVSKQLSRFHSVCKDGETNSETGEVRMFYGSPGELCALCPAGAICQRESYAQPQSKAGGYSVIVHVDAVPDITCGTVTCKHQQMQDQRWDSYSCQFFMFVCLGDYNDYNGPSLSNTNLLCLNCFFLLLLLRFLERFTGLDGRR